MMMKVRLVVKGKINADSLSEKWESDASGEQQRAATSGSEEDTKDLTARLKISKILVFKLN